MSVTQKNEPSTVVIHYCAWYVFLRHRYYMYFAMTTLLILYLREHMYNNLQNGVYVILLIITQPIIAQSTASCSNAVVF